MAARRRYVRSAKLETEQPAEQEEPRGYTNAEALSHACEAA